MSRYHIEIWYSSELCMACFIMDQGSAQGHTILAWVLLDSWPLDQMWNSHICMVLYAAINSGLWVIFNTLTAVSHWCSCIVTDSGGELHFVVCRCFQTPKSQILCHIYWRLLDAFSHSLEKRVRLSCFIPGVTSNDTVTQRDKSSQYRHFGWQKWEKNYHMKVQLSQSAINTRQPRVDSDREFFSYFPSKNGSLLAFCHS